MTTFRAPRSWEDGSVDPLDETFGDVIEPCRLADADLTDSTDPAEPSADRVDVIADPSLPSAGTFDAVLVGEPYDGAVIGRPGAREGPRALRDALSGTKTHHLEDGPVGSIGDLGDVTVPDGGVEAVQRTLQETTARVYESGALPVFLGGDNSLTVPNAAPLLERGSLGIVNFDAHLDCREVHDGPTSGTPYRQLLERGLDAYAVLGARHFETSTTYVEYALERGAEIVPSETVGLDPIAAADRALESLGDVDAIYVSVDLDVLDATAAPGVSAPTPGGLTTRELYGALRRVASEDRVSGFEVVECAPSLESGALTQRAGARAVAHFLSAYGAGQAPEPEDVLAEMEGGR